MDDLFLDLHACINCLGILDNGRFVKDVDTTVSVRDILRYLRRESNQCEIRLELGKFNVVVNHLIPLLKSNYNDSVLFDLIIRLLMNLSQPAIICFKQELPTDINMMEIYIKVDNILQKIKSHFADRDLLVVLVNCVNEIFNKVWEDRSEDDHMMVERILILVRNILHINTCDLEGQVVSGTKSQHDKLVLVMMESGFKELLIYLSNTEDESRFAFHTLEIISLIFREQSCDFMKQSSSSLSDHVDTLVDRNLLRQEELDRLEKRTVNPRALRFGGTFELRNIKSSSGMPMIYHHDVSSGKIDLSRDRKMIHKPKSRLANKEKVYVHKSPPDVTSTLQDFCDLFLEFGYNTLMSASHDCLVRKHVQIDDETYYLWAIKFFMAVCRLNKRNPSFVSETMSADVFHWVYSQAISYFDLASSLEKSKIKSCFRKLRLVIGAFNELLEFLLMLDRHEDEKFVRLSAGIKCKVFYHEEYLDMYPMLLTKFHSVKQSRAYLCDLIEGSCLMIKILQNHKSFDMNVVRKLKKKRIKKKKAQKSTEETLDDKPIDNCPIASDTIEELTPIWERMIEPITLGLQGSLNLPDHSTLPVIFDPLLPQQREPIEPGSEPIDTQLKRALGMIQIRLRQEKPLEAAAMFQLTQLLWPEEEHISVEDAENPVEESVNILRTVMFASKFYDENDLSVNGPKWSTEQEAQEEGKDEENGNFDQDNSEFDEEPEHVTEEVEFSIEKYLMKFCHPKIVSVYGIIFNDFVTNSSSTNDSLIRIMHQIAEKSKMPYVLYQLKLLNGFSQFLEDPLSKLSEFRSMRKFVLFIIRKFTAHCKTNPKLLIEILFMKTQRESWQTVNGYENFDENRDDRWTDDLDAELTRLFEEAKTEEILPGLDPINVVENRFSDPTKTRRQIICRMISLGLIKSLKEFKKKKRNVNPWTGEEQARLIILFEEARGQPNPIKEIMNGLRATATDPTSKRSRKAVVRKILELGLVNNAEELGVFSKPDKTKKFYHNEQKKQDDDSSDSESANDEDQFLERQFEGHLFSNTLEDELEMFSIRRKPPVPKTKRMVDWTAFKMTFARLTEDQRDWFVEMLVENIDSRSNGIVGYLTLVPVMERDSEVLDVNMVQKLLSLCYFLCPDVSEGHHFWRIPEDMTGKELDYFRNCAVSLTEDELKALTMTDLDEEIKNTNPKRSIIDKRNIPKMSSTDMKNDQNELRSLEEESEIENDDGNKENLISSEIINETRRQITFLSDEESETTEPDFLSYKSRRSKRIIMDSSEEEEEDAPIQKRKRIVDDDSD